MQPCVQSEWQFIPGKLRAAQVPPGNLKTAERPLSPRKLRFDISPASRRTSPQPVINRTTEQHVLRRQFDWLQPWRLLYTMLG